jgi:Na+-transporting methylmalonyl-CoA/oxaloacetate decarboxylase gamma subunit
MQIVLLFLAIVIAVSYLGKKFYRRFFIKESSCDGCVLGKTGKEKHKD